MRKWRSIAVVLAHVAAYVALYQLAHIIYQKPILPSLDALWQSLMGMDEASVLAAYKATYSRWFVVFVVGAGTGGVCGGILGFFPRLGRFFTFDIDFWRSLPATVLVQFFFALFGDNEVTRAAPALYLMFFTTAYYVSRAGASIDRRRFSHLKQLGASTWFVIRESYVYEVLPAFMIALRQGVSLAFLVLISTELIIGSSNNTGIGNRLVDWLFYASYANVVITILLLGLSGYLANIVAKIIQSRLIYWRDPRQEL